MSLKEVSFIFLNIIILKKLKDKSLFLCSGYGFYEFFLKKKYKNFVISDSQKIYELFNKNINYPITKLLMS